MARIVVDDGQISPRKELFSDNCGPSGALWRMWKRPAVRTVVYYYFAFNIPNWRIEGVLCANCEHNNMWPKSSQENRHKLCEQFFSSRVCVHVCGSVRSMTFGFVFPNEWTHNKQQTHTQGCAQMLAPSISSDVEEFFGVMRMRYWLAGPARVQCSGMPKRNQAISWWV